MTSAPDYIVDLVRRQDRDRFITAMFAPAKERAALLALYAFNIELARIPGTVSEPMLGQIRLQWWRDLIGRLAGGGAAPEGHPVSQALAPLVSSDTAAGFTALVDAREAEFGDEGRPNVHAIGSSLSALALRILGVQDAATQDAAREATVARELAVMRDPDVGHVRAHLDAARRPRRSIDRRALPVLLWATIAERRLGRPNAPVPVLRLMWNAWRGRY